MMVQSRSLAVTRGFLAFLVGELGAQPPRHEDALEQESGVAPGVTDAVAGDPDQPAYLGGIHRGDDVGGAGMQVVAGRGGPAHGRSGTWICRPPARRSLR